MSAELARVIAFARRGRDHRDVSAQSRAQLNPHVTEASEADHRHLRLRSDVVLSKRRVSRDPGAKQRSDATDVHAFGDLEAEVVPDDDMVAVTALGDRVIVIVGAIVGLDTPLAAEDFPAFQALVTFHAAVDHAAYRDGVSRRGGG